MPNAGAPLARLRDTARRADGAAARHDHAQVEAAGRDELLDEHSLASEPGPVGDRGERLEVAGRGVAAKDVAAPAAEARLQDHRQRGHELPRPSRLDLASRRMPDACAREQPARGELVVGREQPGRPIQDGDPSAPQLDELEQPRLDAVEREANVDPSDREVAGDEPLDGVSRPQRARSDAGRAPGGRDLTVRLVPLAPDEREGCAGARFLGHRETIAPGRAANIVTTG